MKRVEVIRPDELHEEVILKFNEAALSVMQSIPFNVEVVPQGILITFPKIDHHQALKVTNKRREVKVRFHEDFEDGWYDLVKLGEEDYLIDIILEP